LFLRLSSHCIDRGSGQFKQLQSTGLHLQHLGFPPRVPTELGTVHSIASASAQNPPRSQRLCSCPLLSAAGTNCPASATGNRHGPHHAGNRPRRVHRRPKLGKRGRGNWLGVLLGKIGFYRCAVLCCAVMCCVVMCCVVLSSVVLFFFANTYSLKVFESW
jgi:hypothetical protein